MTKTTMTTALVLGFLLVGAAPAAQAEHEDRTRTYPRGEHFDRTRGERFDRTRGEHFDRNVPHAPSPREIRDLRILASQLERATDELLRRAHRAVRRGDHRHAAPSIQAVYRLEDAADAFRREVARGRVFDHAAHEDLRRLERSFRMAVRQLDGVVRERALRRDLARVDRLLAQLEDAFADHHGYVARGHGHRQRVAWR